MPDTRPSHLLLISREYDNSNYMHTTIHKYSKRPAKNVYTYTPRKLVYSTVNEKQTNARYL